jgi:hypothetical protein
MFSLRNLASSQYFVQVQPVSATTGTISSIDSHIAIPLENRPTSRLIAVQRNFSNANTAADSLNLSNQVDLGVIYSDGYRMSYVDNRAGLTANIFTNQNGARYTTGYVGDKSVPNNPPQNIIIFPHLVVRRNIIVCR